jgi:hypothetical protein
MSRAFLVQINGLVWWRDDHVRLEGGTQLRRYGVKALYHQEPSQAQSREPYGLDTKATPCR